MTIVRFIVHPIQEQDPRSQAYLLDARALGFEQLERIDCQDIYFIDGNPGPDALNELADRLLHDPVTQTVEWSVLEHGAVTAETAVGVFEVQVAPRPGVTDPVAEEIVRAAQVLHIAGVKRASTGQRFLIKGAGLDRTAVELLTRRLLANPVIQHFALGAIEPSFPSTVESSARVEMLVVRGLDDEKLLALSRERRAALDIHEMRAVQQYCEREARELTDIEFEAIAQTWSEHCVHKTFKARVEIENYAALDPLLQAKYPGGQVDNLMRTFLKRATQEIGAAWVRSAFVDNAGIIDFDGVNEVSFKVETHNHPSAVEPFGGANTGVGGVIRDVMGVSARPVAATDRKSVV